MGVIWTNRTRNKPPQSLVLPNSQFRHKLYSLRELNEPNAVSVLSGVKGTPSSGVSSTVSSGLRGITFAATSAAISLPPSEADSGGGDFSVLFVGRVSTGTYRFAGSSLTGDSYWWGHSGTNLLFTLSSVEDINSSFAVSDGSLIAVLYSYVRGVGVTFTVCDLSTGVTRQETVAYAGSPLTNAATSYIGCRILDFGWNAPLFLEARWQKAVDKTTARELVRNPWQLFAPEHKPLIFNLSTGGSTVTGEGSSVGVGAVSGVGASTSAQVGSSAGIGSASGVGASTANSVGSSTGTGASSGVGSSTGGSDGVGSSTGTGTATGVGASTAASLGSTAGVGTASGVGASTAASTGSASGTGEALGVGTNGSIVSTGVGTASGTGTATGISPSVSQGGGKTTGKNLSRKQKKKLKAVESQEWLKAEETARQLLSDRFTKQTPQEKAQALETHIESLQPVIEALKALTDQIEDVQETVQETKTEELTEHKQILNKFDALITKMTSIEELLIIMLAQ